VFERRAGVFFFYEISPRKVEAEHPNESRAADGLRLDGFTSLVFLLILGAM
jgi:hypothetical protein